jgi:small subunit ribosomal protein S13
MLERNVAPSLMSQEFRHIVRIAGRDLDGTKKLIPAIAEIKGVGGSYANAMVSVLKLDSRARLGQLSDKQLQQVEVALKDPTSLNLPVWLLNRRKDVDSGQNIHRIGSDLDFMIKNDLDREKNVLSWRGIRHSLGLKVRGQRTRTTGRKGRTVGVKKSSLQAAQAAKTAAEKSEKK